MQEHKHVIHVLKEAKKAAQKGDVVLLKQLSDQTVHASAIHQDTDNILVAILIYALSKLLERRKLYSEGDFREYFNYYLGTIDHSIKCIGEDKCDIFRREVGNLTKKRGLATDLKRSAESVFRKARINKASKVYEHGISMEATSKMLGISLWELAEYTGQSHVSDMRQNDTLEVRQRIKKAMEMFR